MIKRSRKLTAVALTAVLMAAGGCSSSSSTKSNSGKALDKVTYVTAFGAAGRDAFAWVALDKGYFKDAGIDAKIELGAATDSNLKLIASSQAQFANLDLTGAMIQAGKGTYKDFKIIAAVHQQTLVSIMALDTAKINSPKDLEGKKIGAATGSVNQQLFPAYARLAGADPSKVSWIGTTPQGIGALLATNKVDALSTFLIGRPTIEKAVGGKTIKVLPYSDYLSDLYGNGIITTPALATQNPDLVKRFRDAALRGLKYTIEHPDEAADILHKAQPATAAAAASGEIKLMSPYVTSASSGVPVGAVDKDKMARAIAILQGSGLIPAGLTPETLVDFSLTPKA
jgi:NitT/TauT family transport system substrate-binding protein